MGWCQGHIWSSRSLCVGARLAVPKALSLPAQPCSLHLGRFLGQGEQGGHTLCSHSVQLHCLLCPQTSGSCCFPAARQLEGGTSI